MEKFAPSNKEVMSEIMVSLDRHVFTSDCVSRGEGN